MFQSILGFFGWRQPKKINLAFFDDAASKYPLAQMVEKVGVERLAHLKDPQDGAQYLVDVQNGTMMRSIFGQSGLSRLAENDLFNEISEGSRRKLLDAHPGVAASELPLDLVVAEMSSLPSLAAKTSAWLDLNPGATLTVWRDGPAAAIPRDLVQEYLPPGSHLKNAAELFLEKGRGKTLKASPDEVFYSGALQSGNYPQAERYFAVQAEKKLGGNVVSFWDDPSVLTWPPPPKQAHPSTAWYVLVKPADEIDDPRPVGDALFAF